MPSNCINILNLYQDSKLDFHLFYSKIMDKMQQIIVNTINNIYSLRLKQVFSENDFNVSMKILNDLYDSCLLAKKLKKKNMVLRWNVRHADKLFVIVCSLEHQKLMIYSSFVTSFQCMK